MRNASKATTRTARRFYKHFETPPKKKIKAEKIIEISTFNLKCNRSIFPLLLIAYILICDFFCNERSMDNLIIYTLLSYYACLFHNSYIDIMI